MISATLSGHGYTVRDRTPDEIEIGNQSRLRELDGRTYLLADTGYYRLDARGVTAVASYAEDDPFFQSSTDSLLVLEQGPDGRIWRVYTDRVEITACSIDCVTTTPSVLQYTKWSYPVSLHVDSSGVAWISTGSTLVRYDPSVDVDKKYEAIFPALLRRATSIDTNRLLYGGLRGAGPSDQVPIFSDLPSDQNAVHFEFALPSYNDAENNEFQYWLEGRDAEWSTWTADTGKNYTNLTEGTYRFHLRGRNAQGYVSPASVYTFTVLPPWYRSTWAYIIYALGLVGAGLFARRYRRIVVENKRARKQAKALERERQVNERLQDLNKRLEQANETLRQADRLKDEFLANTSHELRTPLTGILGCSAILRDEVEGEQREFVNMIDENGQRLLNTLDSLLDLARLRAGLMDLDFKEMDLGKKSRAILQTYSSLAESKGIDLHVETEGDVCGWFDDHCMECMLNHLIGNAVKFTGEGGVRVELREDDQRIVIRVKDTGIGIDEEFMPFLFDEFKQESTGLTRSHEGNGLGLAVTARIIDLMGGDIEVESEKEVGTTFTVQLPLERVKPGISRQGDGLPGETVAVTASDRGSDVAAT